jgi:hypothetical protein
MLRLPADSVTHALAGMARPAYLTIAFCQSTENRRSRSSAWSDFFSADGNTLRKHVPCLTYQIPRARRNRKALNLLTRQPLEAKRPQKQSIQSIFHAYAAAIDTAWRRSCRLDPVRRTNPRFFNRFTRFLYSMELFRRTIRVSPW